MKEIEKMDAPGVAGGYRDNGSGGCIPLPLPLPGPDETFPVDPYPGSPFGNPEPFVSDPPAA